MNLPKDKILRVFILTFLFVVFVGFLVQFVVLPYILPHLNAGNGLLKEHDSYSHHETAVELADKIRAQGWSQWKLRYRNLIEPALIAPFYYFAGPRPWLLIPVNALIHALSAVVIFLLTYGLVPHAFHKKNETGFLWLLAPVAPFVFFPSSLLWTTQILKDGLAFLGCLTFVLGLRFGFQFISTLTTSFTVLFNCLICIWGGAAIGWLARPYLLEIFQLEILLLTLFLFLWFARQTLQKKPSIVRSTTLIFCLLLTYFSIKHLRSDKIESLPSVESSFRVREETRWTDTAYVPSFVEGKLYAISRIRVGFSNTPGGSNLDTDIQFKKALDVLLYLPRAIEIGFLAPFPISLLRDTNNSHTGFAKRFVLIEMLLTYLIIPFMLYQIFKMSAHIETWIITGGLSFFILLYALTVTNMGTLHRFRYGFITALLGLGLPRLFFEAQALIHRLKRKVENPFPASLGERA